MEYKSLKNERKTQKRGKGLREERNHKYLSLRQELIKEKEQNTVYRIN